MRGSGGRGDGVGAVKPAPERGGYLVVPTAMLDRLLNLARWADPDSAASTDERERAGRRLVVEIEALIKAPRRGGAV